MVKTTDLINYSEIVLMPLKTSGFRANPRPLFFTGTTLTYCSIKTYSAL